ncbi:MAG: 2-phospho-L-lactate transferase [Caldilineales bacterium]|nr:2-phospho-L-lactate transferase [Caldilineales bacterium]MCX7854208.1 2-phospho-L-lactate transferase [Caldilineales bacterium]
MALNTALPRLVALAGGVGGARLAHGLAHRLDPDHLSIIVNTGDDFEHLGLLICPDLDTVLYNLAGVHHPDQGWGRADETFHVLEEAARLGHDPWFRLGDKDLALHLLRRQMLAAGLRLTAVTAELARRFGVVHPILPMSDDPVRTVIGTPEGELAFQDYFVRQRCRPRMVGMRLEGLETARPAPAAVAALERAEAVVICPSNPYVSIGPILALPGLRERVQARPTVAVSPIVGGQALKGPAAKMMAELGVEVSALGVARHYAGLIRGFVLDQRDAHLAPAVAALGLRVLVTDTVMTDTAARVRLAGEVLAFVRELIRES